MTARRAMALMSVFAAAWALVEAIAGGVLARYSPFQVVFTRYVVHLGLVLGFALKSGVRPWRSARPVYQLARSSLMLGMPACFVFSMAAGVDPNALTLIFWSSPLLVLALAALVVREPTERSVWLTSLIAGLGAALLIGRAGFSAGIGLLFPAGMALTFSLYAVMTRSLRDERTLVNLFYTALVPAGVLLPFMAKLWITPGPRDLVVMVAIGAIGLLTLWALDRSTALAPLSISAPFIYLQLPLFLVLDWLLHGSHIGLRVGVGLAAVFGCLAYLWHTADLRSRAAPA